MSGRKKYSSVAEIVNTKSHNSIFLIHMMKFIFHMLSDVIFYNDTKLSDGFFDILPSLTMVVLITFWQKLSDSQIQ